VKCLLGWCDVVVGHQPVQVDLLGACGAGALFSGAGGAGAGVLLAGAGGAGAGVLLLGAGGAGAGVLLLGACGAGALFSGAGGAGAGSLLVGACAAGALLPGAWDVWAGADDVKAPARNAAPTQPIIRLKLMDSVSHTWHHTIKPNSQKGNPNPPPAVWSRHYNASSNAVSEDFADFSENA